MANLMNLLLIRKILLYTGLAALAVWLLAVTLYTGEWLARLGHNPLPEIVAISGTAAVLLLCLRWAIAPADALIVTGKVAATALATVAALYLQAVGLAGNAMGGQEMEIRTATHQCTATSQLVVEGCYCPMLDPCMGCKHYYAHRLPGGWLWLQGQADTAALDNSRWRLAGTIEAL